MVIPLSYPLHKHTPLYSRTPPIEYFIFKSMENGDSSNHSVISLSCHSGTHIDAPRHFCVHGKSIIESLQRVNEFYPAYCWNLPKGSGDAVTVADLLTINCPEYTDARAILIRTGWFKMRDRSPEQYINKNPWLDPEVVPFLRAHFPSLRLIGIDTISIANTSHKEQGRAAHRALLCTNPPIIILEDADLSDQSLTTRLLRMTIYPVILDEIEAVPVVVIADIG
jgi:arylformamidase